MSPLYMHPASLRRPWWQSVALRLSRYVVEGATIGRRGFLRRKKAMDYYYHASRKNETHAPISIYRKPFGAKPED